MVLRPIGKLFVCILFLFAGYMIGTLEWIAISVYLRRLKLRKHAVSGNTQQQLPGDVARGVFGGWGLNHRVFLLATEHP